MPPHPSIRVEFYRAEDEDIDALLDYLSVSDAIEKITYPAVCKPSGLGELGTAFYVFLKPVLEVYAANKLLDIVYDEIAEWYRKRAKKNKNTGNFITISKGSRKKKIGSGKPRRYRP